VIDYEKTWEAIQSGIIDTMTTAEYKNYVLGFLFYRCLSEKQERYLQECNVLDIPEGQTVNAVYTAAAAGDDLADYLEDISASLGYAIGPGDTWASLTAKIEDGEIIPSDYQTLFDHFNKHSQLNADAEKHFKGIFADVNTADTRRGADRGHQVLWAREGVDYLQPGSHEPAPQRCLVQQHPAEQRRHIEH
jgi:type I restriction enzyme M protein